METEKLIDKLLNKLFMKQIAIENVCCILLEAKERMREKDEKTRKT